MIDLDRKVREAMSNRNNPGKSGASQDPEGFLEGALLNKDVSAAHDKFIADVEVCVCVHIRVVQRFWGGRGCRKFVPVLREDGAQVAPPGDIFDQPPGEMSSIRGKLTDHVEDHAILSPQGAV